MTRLTSLVLPAYNPGPAVERTWVAVEQFIASRRGAWEAIFVLDGCTDDSESRLKRLAKSSHERMRLISYAGNRGKGFAVRTGLLAAAGDVRLFTDVDLAYTFRDIVRVARTVRRGSPIAIASREHPQSEQRLPVGLLRYARRRQIQSRAFNFLTRSLLPIFARDTQAGLKGMTAAVAESLVPELRCDGFGFDCELLTACAHAGVAIAEVPVCVRTDSAASTTGPRATLRMLRELWQIRRSWRNRTIAVRTISTSDRPATEPLSAAA